MGSAYPKNIKKFEMVQCWAARYVSNRHRNRSSVSDMPHGFNWRSLQDRRKDSCLCMLYKVERRLVAIKKDRRLISSKKKTRNRFQTFGCKTDGRKMSFPRTVRHGRHIGTGLTIRLQGHGVNHIGPVDEVALTCIYDIFYLLHNLSD